jgi:integrase
VRLKKDGREAWFNLGTPNQAAAARKAKEIFTFLEANGWETTLAKFKPESDVAPKLDLTVGDYLQAAENTGYVTPRTFLHYKNCFRLIISEVFGVRGGDSKFDYRSADNGHGKWVERIDAIHLERVTPARVTAWQQQRIKKAGHSPMAIASAKRTTNSYVRCARSLFGRDIRKRLTGIRLPDPLPFDGVELFDSGSMKYVSKVDVQALIAAARSELKPNEPEVYKGFLLGLFAGMRRAEIDLAEWRMVDWQNNVIRLEETEWLHLKTQDSAGEITVDAEVIAELRELLPSSQSQFILTSDRRPRNDSVRVYYRCQEVFDRLNDWLRSKGVKAHKPLHEMRKEIGALIATQHGIYAASRFLRHSDITTTARQYADHKARISVGLGKLLDTEIKPAADTAPASAA